MQALGSTSLRPPPSPAGYAPGACMQLERHLCWKALKPQRLGDVQSEAHGRTALSSCGLQQAS